MKTTCTYTKEDIHQLGSMPYAQRAFTFGQKSTNQKPNKDNELQTHTHTHKKNRDI